jgi:hypothetical protein
MKEKGKALRLEVEPINYRDAAAFINKHHRHHKAPQGCKFCIAVTAAGKRVGVAIAGRPVSRYYDDGFTLEVTRCCTLGTENACSFLYGACSRIAKEMGYERIITYILKGEVGTSLRASGWEMLHPVKGRSWNCSSRPRQDKHPTVDKVCYGRGFY